MTRKSHREFSPVELRQPTKVRSLKITRKYAVRGKGMQRSKGKEGAHHGRVFYISTRGEDRRLGRKESREKEEELRKGRGKVG